MSRNSTCVVAIALAALAALASTAAPAAAQGQAHCGQITNNETWTRQASPHNVTCDVIVRNSVLTIEAGALILMHANSNLVVEQGGSMQAIGNNAGRIRFRAIADDSPPGSWGQLRFMGGASPSALEFVDVNDGGAGGAPMVQILDTVVVMGTQPTAASEAKNVRLYNAAGVPLSITANEVGPSLAGAGDYTQGRGCWQLAIEASNVVQAIEVQASGEPDVTDTQTWFNFCVPYIVEDVITVAGPDAPSLELNPGVELRFGVSGGLQAGLDAGNQGQFEANGTYDERVVLRGRADGPGQWGSLELTDFTAGGHGLSHTEISGGGEGGVPMMRVTTAEAFGGGIHLTDAQAYPLEIVADGVQNLLEEGWVAGEPALSGNAVNRVLVTANAAVDLPRGTTWGNPGAPYEVEGTLTVGRNGGARFRLLAGTEVRFRANHGLEIGGDSAGSAELVTQGEPGRPVILSGIVEEPGSWAGITVTDDADGVTLKGAIVSFGGSIDSPMIRWGDAQGSITSTVLSDAPGYPFEISLGHAGVLLDDLAASPAQLCSAVDRCANTLERNAVDRFLVHGGDVGASGRMDWHDPGAPVELAGGVALTGTAMRLNLHDGLDLRFRPGEGVALGDGVLSQATLHFTDEDPEARTTLGATDQDSGWAGVRVLAGSEVTGSGAAIDRGAARGASLDLVGGSATLHDVSFTNSLGAGVRVYDDSGFSLVRGHVEDNVIGVIAGNPGARAHEPLRGGWVSLYETTVAGNTEWGVRNEHEAFCIDAVRVYWGRPAGPDDSSDAPDPCTSAANSSPGADKVSDWVDWWPYATNGGDYAPAPGLGPNPRTIFVPHVSMKVILRRR